MEETKKPVDKTSEPKNQTGNQQTCQNNDRQNDIHIEEYQQMMAVFPRT